MDNTEPNDILENIYDSLSGILWVSVVLFSGKVEIYGDGVRLDYGNGYKTFSHPLRRMRIDAYRRILNKGSSRADFVLMWGDIDGEAHRFFSKPDQYEHIFDTPMKPMPLGSLKDIPANVEIRFMDV